MGNKLLILILTIIIICIIYYFFIKKSNIFVEYELYNQSYIPFLESLNTKMFVDSANLDFVRETSLSSLFHGFTTNPNLLLKENIKSYFTFAKQYLHIVPDRPVSFQIITDNLNEMYNQGKKLASLGKNVFVKIPIITTRGQSCASVIKKLNDDGIKVNVTGVLHFDDLPELKNALSPNIDNFISIWVGRMSDNGKDPIPNVKKCIKYIRSNFPKVHIIWASVRSVNDIFIANDLGCDIITISEDIIRKLPNLGKHYKQMSREFVHEFLHSAKTIGLTLDDDSFINNKEYLSNDIFNLNNYSKQQIYM